MLKALIVDDEVESQQIFSIVLANAGYEVTVARDGEEALAILESQDFSFLLLDLNMPKINGLELLRRLRSGSKSYAHTKIMLSTAQELNADHEVLKLADGFLPKPFDVIKLQKMAMDYKASLSSLV